VKRALHVKWRNIYRRTPKQKAWYGRGLALWVVWIVLARAKHFVHLCLLVIFSSLSPANHARQTHHASNLICYRSGRSALRRPGGRRGGGHECCSSHSEAARCKWPSLFRGGSFASLYV